MQSRQTAYKVWVSDLNKGKFVVQHGEWEPNYVEVGDLKVSRVNVIVTVINEFKNEGYRSVDIDDGSGVIRAKVWKDDVALLENIGIGDSILMIAKVRQFNDQTYLTPEIIKKLDNLDWIKVRKLELEKNFGGREKEERKLEEDKPVETKVVEEKVLSENTRQKILNIVEVEDEISKEALIEKSGLPAEEVEQVIQDLLKEGEVYTPRAGVLKVV